MKRSWSSLVEAWFSLLYKFKHQYIAVSTKVVSQKSKSVRDNADWYYG